MIGSTPTTRNRAAMTRSCSESIEIPRKITCAECGETLTAVNSFGVSVPLDSTLAPADFCSIGCLMDWAIDVHEERLDEFRGAF